MDELGRGEESRVGQTTLHSPSTHIDQEVQLAVVNTRPIRNEVRLWSEPCDTITHPGHHRC